MNNCKTQYNNRNTRKRIIIMEKLVLFVSAIAGLFVACILLAWPTQWLWNNALIGAIDGLNPIGFWQALGINVLCSILFKNSNSK
jgi:sterol desaturase/sphingolipid hydroxylase (fatty acid hydroxylase superfamily)